MKGRTQAGATAAIVLLLSACVAVPLEPIFTKGEFGMEQTFTGVLRLSFERQSFNECYLDFTGSAVADLGRLAPSLALNDHRAFYSADITLVGRRRGPRGCPYVLCL
jgi:hypothetical protein